MKFEMIGQGGGGNTAYLVKNVILAIREEDAKQIMILRKENGTY